MLRRVILFKMFKMLFAPGQLLLDSSVHHKNFTLHSIFCHGLLNAYTHTYTQHEFTQIGTVCVKHAVGLISNKNAIKLGEQKLNEGKGWKNIKIFWKNVAMRPEYVMSWTARTPQKTTACNSHGLLITIIRSL